MDSSINHYRHCSYVTLAQYKISTPYIDKLSHDTMAQVLLISRNVCFLAVIKQSLCFIQTHLLTLHDYLVVFIFPLFRVKQLWNNYCLNHSHN